MIVVCEICRNEIAETTEAELSLPIKGSMFHAHRAGFPPPFLHDDLEWENMRCRYCGTRPFLKHDGFMTTEGYYPVIAKPNKDVETVFKVVEQMPVRDIDPSVCPKCGKAESGFKSKAGFLSHKRSCKGKE